jgi:hypothetical protein
MCEANCPAPHCVGAAAGPEPPQVLQPGPRPCAGGHVPPRPLHQPVISPSAGNVAVEKGKGGGESLWTLWGLFWSSHGGMRGSLVVAGEEFGD